MTDNVTVNKEVFAAVAWIEELLSDGYAKGTESLGDDDEGYCCLGVGCVALNIDFYKGDDHSIELATKVGLLNEYGEFESKYKEMEIENDSSSLVSLNDETELSLKEIGEFIRDHTELLFNSATANLINEHYKNEEEVK